MAEDDDAESRSFLALGAERGPTVMLPAARVVSGLRTSAPSRGPFARKRRSRPIGDETCDLIRDCPQ